MTATEALPARGRVAGPWMIGACASPSGPSCSSTGLESVPKADRDAAHLLSGASGPGAATRIPFTPGTPIRLSALIDGRQQLTQARIAGAHHRRVTTQHVWEGALTAWRSHGYASWLDVAIRIP